MSIAPHARRKYGVPQLDLNAIAIALGGHVSEVRSPPDAKGYTPCKVPLEGVAAALPLGGDGALAERREAVTLYEGLPLASFAYGRAEVALGLPGNRSAVVARTQVDGLVLGHTHQLTVGSMQVEQSARSTSCHHDFALHASIDKVSFGRKGDRAQMEAKDIELDADDLPRSYEKLADNLERYRPYLLPHSRFRPGKDDAASGRTIALHLVRKLPWGDCHIGNGEKTAPNGLYLEGFGQVYFGELIVTPRFRRFSAIRFVFGCDQGGGGSSGDAGTGGSDGGD